MSKIAILAYGSLIDDPGPELSQWIVDRRSVETPFHVEYARASRKRGGAPTLIPVATGGSKVAAILLMLDPQVSEPEAKDMLWRRETGLKGHYAPPANPSRNHVLIDVHSNLADIQVVLSTRIGSNIQPLTAQELARRAVDSAKNPEVKPGENGISYLIRAQKAGVITPLTTQYEAAILELTGTRSLEDAVRSVSAQTHRRVYNPT